MKKIVLTRGQFIDDIKAKSDAGLKKGLLLVPGAIVMILVFVIVNTRGKMTRMNAEKSRFVWIFIGVFATLIASAVVFGYIRSKREIGNGKIRIVEDVLIDRHSYTPSRSGTVYYLVGLSGTTYSVDADSYAYYSRPFHRAYIVYPGERRNSNLRMIYDGDVFVPDEEMKQYITPNDLPAPEDRDAQIQKMVGLYMGRGFTNESGKPGVGLNRSIFAKCPHCRRTLYGTDGYTQNCPKCGQEYRFQLRDLVWNREMHANEIGMIEVSQLMQD